MGVVGLRVFALSDMAVISLVSMMSATGAVALAAMSATGAVALAAMSATGAAVSLIIC